MGKRCYGCMKIREQGPVCEHCGYHEGSKNLPFQLPLGTVLDGQYEIGKVLGQGGFGITYLAWDLRLEAPVAIKEYYPHEIVQREAGSCRLSCTYDQEAFQSGMENFMQEAKILAKLREQAGVVRVYSSFEENGTAYFVMEYLDGDSLEEYVEKMGGFLTIQETLELLEPIMSALATVHEAGLIHRDVSPDNIKLKQNGEIKLLDFGIAKDATSKMTRSVDRVFKLGYAPLEQIAGRDIGPWTDVYALCATIYYCLTGTKPPDSMERAMEKAPLDWYKIPDLTPGQIAALDTGMAVQSEDRYASVDALCADLLSLEEKKRRIPIPLIAGILSAAVGLGAFLLMEKTPEETARLDHSGQSEAYGQTAEALPDLDIPDVLGTIELDTGSPFASAQVGQLIDLGRYEQDGDQGNGPETIRWRVLDKQEGRILVISAVALDVQPYHEEYKRVTWETSTLRQWLNEDFCAAAFTQEELAMIETTMVLADPNPEYTTGVGLETSDRIFLLSASEAERYFSDDAARRCGVTNHAEDLGVYVNSQYDTVWWWLRTPGHSERDACSVNSDGSLDLDDGSVNSVRGAVRPAMWIRTSGQ